MEKRTKQKKKYMEKRTKLREYTVENCLTP